jgi:hypothetical protein
VKFNVLITVDDTTFEVVGCFERYVPGRTSGHPDEWEPAEPEEFDVESINVNGADMTEFLDDYYYRFISDCALQELRSNS